MLKRINVHIALVISFLTFLGASTAISDEARKSNEGANVYIISPLNGDVLSSPVTVKFGLSGMGVAPAGIDKSGTGHHHLIVDAALPPLNEPIPADENHRHFGGGQTETTIELDPGLHTLQLLLADHYHIPHDPPVYSKVITIEIR